MLVMVKGTVMTDGRQRDKENQQEKSDLKNLERGNL